MEKKILKKCDRIRVCLKIFYSSNKLQMYVLDLTTLRQYSFFFKRYVDNPLQIRCALYADNCVRRVTLLSSYARDGNIYKHLQFTRVMT